MSQPTASNGDHVCEECGHDSDEHSYNGCDYYTPEWPRLVRCSCTRRRGGEDHPMSQRRRQGLEDRARELGCFPDPENYTDQQLRDAIDCEEACIGWERRFNQLPTDAAKRDAIHRLRLSLGGEGREDHPMSQRRVAA